MDTLRGLLRKEGNPPIESKLFFDDDPLQFEDLVEAGIARFLNQFSLLKDPEKKAFAEYLKTG